MSFKSWLKNLQKIARDKILGPNRRRQGKWGKASPISLRFEELENRLAPATLSDGGTSALSIVLGAGENLAIVSNGTSYTFSSNQNFTAAGGTDPANQSSAFSGFGHASLSLTSAGISQYGTGINITDAGAGATVTFNNSGTKAYSNNFNVNLSNAAAGSITFNGNSSFGAFNLQASTTLNISVNNAASLISSSGNLTLLANQQTTPRTGFLSGIEVNGASIKCTGTGVITIQGNGGSGVGVDIHSLSTISGGTGPVGVIIKGVGNGDGVLVIKLSTITSLGGSVQITGKGGSGSFESHHGVNILLSQVIAGGTGNIIIQGTSGENTNNYGNNGVYIFGSITSNGGNIQITGEAGSGSTSPGLFLSTYTVSTPAAGGNITLIGDSMQLSSGSVNAGTNMVTLAPLTTGSLINLGGPDAAETLGLTNAELGLITAGTLNIGKPDSGAITVSSAITLPRTANVNLTSGSDIILNPGSFNTAGGALTLNPGITGSVQPITSGTDVATTPGALGFATGSRLAIAINGTTVDSQYNQLNVAGDLNLTGVDLILSGMFTPMGGQTFTIVNNQGAHPIIGEFKGLSEGAVISNFLGSGFNASISYVGGDGNDVILTVINPISTTTMVAASTASVTYGTPVTLTATVAPTIGNTAPTAGSVDFQDGSIDFGVISSEMVSGSNAIFTLITTPNQLQVILANGGNHIITAIYSPGTGFIGSTGTLAGGLKVTPAPLTITATTNMKYFDGTPSAAAMPTVAGLQGNDKVTGLAEVYSDPNLGTGKTLSVSAYTVSDGNNGKNYIIRTVTNTTGAIVPPVTNVSIINTQGSELGPPKGSTANYVFTLHLANALPQAVSANYSTVNGTGSTGAKAGTDLKGANNATVMIPAGVTDVPINITILGDAPEQFNGPADKYFSVQLGWGISTGNNLQNIIIVSATGDIKQTFVPTVSIPASQNVHVNSGGIYQVQVNVTSTYSSLAYAQAAGAVSVSYYTYNGTAKAGINYKRASGILTIPASALVSGTTTVTIPITGMGSAAGQYFNVTLPSISTNAALSSPITGTVYIYNPQLADGQPTGAPGGEVLTFAGQLTPIIKAAEARWQAVGVNPASFKDVQFQIGNIGNGVLANTAGKVITMDSSADGFGWYINPNDDAFRLVGNSVDLFAVAGTPAVGHMDLLTVLERELGHILGLYDMDIGTSLMATILGPGIRRLP